MLSDAAQQSLPQDAQVALQQVDNCTFKMRIALSVECDLRRILLPRSIEIDT